MRKETVSIIIPVYNVELYLERCIKSVIQQSYKKLEIILVNDGSQDNSAQICDRYAKMDERIVVLHKKNGGLSDARNCGLSNAKGEYITFLDSDDYLNTEYINYLVQLLEKNNAELSMCGYQKVYDTPKSKNKSVDKINTEEIISGETALERFCYHKIKHEAWAKLYKKELFSDIKFPVGKLYEDYGTIYKIFYKCKKIAIGNERLYYYYQRANSIMNTAFSIRDMDRADLTDEFLNFIKYFAPSLEQASQSRALISYSILLRDCPLNVELKKERQYIVKKMKEYAKQVSKDKNTPFRIKIIAIFTKISIRGTRYIGKLMQKKR